MRYNRYIKHILNRKLGGYVYEKGDLIIYGNQSVCRIENIGVISIGKQPNSRKYYTLNPTFILFSIYAITASLGIFNTAANS